MKPKTPFYYNTEIEKDSCICSYVGLNELPRSARRRCHPVESDGFGGPARGT